MKLKAFFLSAFIFGFGLIGTAQASFMMGPSQEAKQATFDTIIENVDETTATSLTDKQTNVEALMSEFKSLIEAEEKDEAAISTLREEIKAARTELRTEIKTVLDENDELKSTVKAQVREARAERRAMHHVMRNDEAFSQIVSAADESQAQTLEANRTEMETLKSDMKTARESGVSSDAMADLREQMMALREEQKTLVDSVLESNTELKQTLVDEAKESRPGGRPDRGDRPRPIRVQ